jgi:general secretion pathway protein D
MATALVTCLFLSAALLPGAEGPKESARPSTSERMMRVTYPVADLVIPVDQDKGRDAAVRRPKQAPVARLMKLIRTTVAPASWQQNGGPGVMEYYPAALGLVVCQTQDVQEQVAELLAALRRLQDVEVAVEIRLVSVSESFLERLGLSFDTKLIEGPQSADVQAFPRFPESESAYLAGLEKAAQLDERQLKFLLQAAQGDRQVNVLRGPRVTVLNGQKARVDVTEKRYFVTGLDVVQKGSEMAVLPRNEAIDLGTRFTVQPVVAPDRRSVVINLAASLTELASATVPMVPVTTPLIVRLGRDGQEYVVPVRQYVQQPAVKTMVLDKSFRLADGKTAVVRWCTRIAEYRTESDSPPNPVLSKIPYFNRINRNVGYGRDAQTLLLLVTPRIIVNAEEGECNAVEAAAPVVRPGAQVNVP